MRTSHVSLPAFLALACALCALPARAQLTPENKADNPYVPQAGDLATRRGWSVLNAADKETQDTDLSGYTFTADGTESYLDFSGDANPLGGLETVYLALGIADTDGSPIEMTRDDTNAFRTDNVYAKVRFERSANAPSMDDLRTMYPSYQQTGGTAVAPKLGLYVDADGYFCVSRIRAGETATQEDIVFEFCTTKVRYADVSPSEGAVVVRVEFQTFAATTTAPSVRGFRIWVRDAADDAKEICLTAGLGYRWTQDDETKGYTFDFSSLEQGDGCDWFYAIDSAQAMFDQNMNSTALEALNQLAFSATGGGFYSAWLALNGSALTQETLENYAFGDFNAFLQGNPMDNLVTDWASRYGVDLMQYATPTGRRLMAADDVDKAYDFNAFLLDMDPKAQVAQRLQVTGIVPAADGSVTLTVRGPEGCVLKNALRRAGILRVTRAETLEGLATAASTVVPVDKLAFDDGSATMGLPPADDGAPLPFIKVTLQPNEPPAAE